MQGWHNWPVEPGVRMYRYLEAVMRLTMHRDLQGLNAALVEGLREFMQAGCFRLLAIANAARDTEFSESNLQGAVVWDRLAADDPAPRPIEDDEHLVTCVSSRSPTSHETPDGLRLIMPVLSARGVTALLVIEGLRSVECDQQMLVRFLQVYGNQAYLLGRTEIDPLTGLYNRHTFDARIQKTVRFLNRRGGGRAGGDESPQSCFALFDIDHFKLVNDKYGHLFGDEILLLFTRLMTRCFRFEDLLFRYGGEEFAVLLAGTGLDGAAQALERFRRSVADFDFPQVGHKTVSIGLVGINAGDTADDVVARADKALYYAKNNGRNQIACYERLVAEGKIAPVHVPPGDIELF